MPSPRRPVPPPIDPAWCSEARYLGFDSKDHRHRMGLRPLAPCTWLEPDANADAQLALKADLLASRPDEVRHDAGTPAAHDAARRLVLALDDALGRPRWAGLADATTPELLDRAALRTQEDWCLMVREDTWRLRAACVCFPSRWVLAEKVGGTIADIHGPVPRYDDQLGGLVERFMDRLDPARPMWRLNWNLWEDPRLFQPIEDRDATRWPLPRPDQIGERVVLRVERQTLRRLADDVVAFGIRIHQRPLRHLLDEPGAIALLRATVAGIDGSPSGAKKLGRIRAPLVEWLAAAGR